MTTREKKAPKHVKLEKELILASAVTTLAEAAPLWSMERLGVANEEKHCDFCHTPIRYYVRIRCSSPKGVPHRDIGHDCYEIVQQAVVTKEIDSAKLRELRPHIKRMKQYVKRNITSSVAAWLKAAKDLPAELQPELSMVEAVGYASSVEAAEALVAYYKANKKYRLKDRLAVAYLVILDEYPRRAELPREATIADIQEIERAIGEWYKEMNREKGRRREEERLALEVLKERALGDIAVPLTDPSVTNDSGCYEPGFGYTRRPSLVLVFTFPVSARVRIMLPREQIKELLGAKRWNARVAEALQKTIPAQARFSVTDDGALVLADADMDLWLADVARRLGVKTPGERKEERTRQLELWELGRVDAGVVAFDERARRHPHQYFKATLKRAYHPKTNEAQWVCYRGGKKYILAREMFGNYRDGDGEVRLEAIKELTPGSCYLVKITDPVRFLVEHRVAYPARPDSE